ncbi:DUF4124 domain-containing protein [Algibacillus agarilyticus]|uniref:DUF4124 domain-containing protein n=1 Tax=Algibacillus agarilyticus TaxID=2234133 RepID=UPI0013006E9F|nr:DUF4124 domain-containing protein [Algibacillus agarilyticus]
MTLPRAYLLSTFLCLSFTCHAEIYKWVDDNGVVHFSQQKPSQRQNAEEIKVRESNISQPVNVVPTVSRSSNFAKNNKQQNQEEKPTQAECKQGLKRYYAMFSDAENNYSGAEKRAYIAMLNYKIAAAKKACYG